MLHHHTHFLTFLKVGKGDSFRFQISLFLFLNWDQTKFLILWELRFHLHILWEIDSDQAILSVRLQTFQFLFFKTGGSDHPQRSILSSIRHAQRHNIYNYFLSHVKILKTLHRIKHTQYTHVYLFRAYVSQTQISKISFIWLM